MNIKKFAVTVVAVFVTTLVSNFVIHQIILKSAYQATANLWRPETEMQAYMGSMFLGQFLVALFLAWIFVHGYKGKGWMEGIRFGFLVGGFEAGNNLIMCSVAPYPCSLISGLMSSVGKCVHASFYAPPSFSGKKDTPFMRLLKTR